MRTEYENLVVAVEDQCCWLTFTAEKRLNALTEQTLDELGMVLDELAELPEIRVLVVAGRGRAFVAGADISAMATMSVLQAQRFAAKGQAVFNQLEQLPQTSIALVHGYALGGGCELAMACTLRLAAAGTKFGQPEVGLGIIPGFGGTQRLPRLVGSGIALELILGGKPISAERAWQIGLVNEVVPADELDAAARRWVERLAALPPLALQAARQGVGLAGSVDLTSGLAAEAALFASCFATQDQSIGMQGFLEKRTDIVFAGH